MRIEPAYEDCRRTEMAKGYWITFYRSISDPAALAAYGKLAGPAIVSHGGRFLTRGKAVKTYEQGLAQRTTVTEFDSVEQAIDAHNSPPIRRRSGRSATPANGMFVSWE